MYIRCRFLLESLHDLDKNLRSYHSRLTVVLGQPTAALEELFVQYNVKKLTFQRDMEPYSKALEEGVTKLAQSCGVKVHEQKVCVTPEQKCATLYSCFWLVGRHHVHVIPYS